MKVIHGIGLIVHGHGKGYNMWKYEKKLQFPVNIKNKDTDIKSKILYPTSNPKFDPVSIVMFLGTDNASEELYNYCRDYYNSFGNKDFDKCVESLYSWGNK